MDLRWPWVGLALVLVLLGLLVVWSRRPLHRSGPDTRHMAHASRLRGLPRYQRQLRRQSVLLAWMTLGSLVAATGAILLVARPQVVEPREGTQRQRDVMLCLDASVSMYDDNEQVLAQARAVVADLRDARVGLTVFSGAAVTLVPLTSDLGYVDGQLELVEQSFRTGGFGGYLAIAGIDLAGDPRSSLLGDGIVSCAQRFDDLDADRARSIIVTSDNDPMGQAVYSLQQGADFAGEHDVVVHAIAAPRVGDGARAAEFEDAALSTGGSFGILGQDGTARELVERIEGQDAQRVEVPPRQVVTESPRAGTWVATSGLGLLAIGWVCQAGAWRPRPSRRRVRR